jgi:hypothetical protein
MAASITERDTMEKSQKPVLDVRSKYASVRQLVYDMVSEEFHGVTARGITRADAQRADLWKHLPLSSGRPFRSAWEWSKVFGVYQSRPNRFEMSLWRGGSFCALSYGKVSRSGNRVRIDLIEAVPTMPSPLGGPALPILAFAAGAYASIIGASEVWVMDPLPQLEALYKAEGFSGRMPYDRSTLMGQRRIL